MSLDFDSVTPSVPKWEADWNVAKSRLHAHATTLELLDKESEVDAKAWVVQWVSCMDQINAARAITKDEGHVVGVEKSDLLQKGLEFYASWKMTDDAEKRLESPTKGKSLVPTMTVLAKKSVTAAPKSVSVASEDAEMVDATETTSVAGDKGKGKLKVGYGDLPWPEEATSDALIFYNPKCSYCEESKGDRRCVGVKGAICFGCLHAKKKCTIRAVDCAADKPKVITPKLKPIILVSGALDGASAGTSAAAEEEIIVLDDSTRTLLVGGPSKGVHKTKSAANMGIHPFTPETYTNHENGKNAMREIEARIKEWSAMGWRIGEEMCELREFIYGDFA
ncbi:hypothetical protein M405DRAFT_860148 [Rhizopogon salebrosus TDB-379]|nr:hypothetical protein M405DRAFT_860148 [Rhizopogon salebrosus TDB-379]